MQKRWIKIHKKEREQVAAYKLEIQRLERERLDHLKILRKAEGYKDTVPEKSHELTLLSAQLADDKAYLTKLTETCNTKAKEWDQRSGMRAGEVTAITNALTILKTSVAASTTERTVRLLDIHGKKELSTKVANGSAHDEGVVLLQTSRALIRQHLEATNIKQPDEAKTSKQPDEAGDPDEPRSIAKMAQAMIKIDVDYSKYTGTSDTEMKGLAVPDEPHHVKMKTWETTVGLLKKRARTLRSPSIMALVKVASKSPFDKITKLIQELIERLMQEANDDANHQGWCNKQLGLAKETRDRRASEVAHFNIELASSEETRDGLEADIQTLSDEITELEDAFEKVKKERKEESEENSLTVKEAKEGDQAVGQALDTLEKFYKTAAKATVPALVQVSEEPLDSDVIPDAGFEGGAYTGSGKEDTGGIMGMLEVIQSDFERTIKVTEEAELKARNNFKDFGTETKMSLAKKTTTKSAKETMLTETKSQYLEDKDGMVASQKLLDKAIQELLELQPACFPAVDPYEVRVAKRNDEIAALKNALCTLDNEGPEQTEAECS